MDRERGDTGREQEQEASWFTTDSLLGEAVTEGEALPEGEEGETGTVMDSDWLGLPEEGARVRIAGVAADSEGVAV